MQTALAGAVVESSANRFAQKPLNEMELAALPEDMGPAMRALVPRQQLFVVCLLDQGAKMNYKRAAQTAGYGTAPSSHSTMGKRLARSEKVQAALLEEAKKRIGLSAVVATALVHDTIGNGKADLRVRLKAAEIAMDRGGLHAVQQMQVTRVVSREEKLERMVHLAKAMGFDPRQFLGNLADTIEGDFKVLKDVPATGSPEGVVA